MVAIIGREVPVQSMFGAGALLARGCIGEQYPQLSFQPVSCMYVCMYFMLVWQ
jgi:hypothetical protein